MADGIVPSGGANTSRGFRTNNPRRYSIGVPVTGVCSRFLGPSPAPEFGQLIITRTAWGYRNTPNLAVEPYGPLWLTGESCTHGNLISYCIGAGSPVRAGCPLRRLPAFTGVGAGRDGLVALCSATGACIIMLPIKNAVLHSVKRGGDRLRNETSNLVVIA